jgi:P-type Cu2+ transporter
MLTRTPDAAEDLSRFLRHEVGGSTSFEVVVKGAHCANCIAKIERGVSAIARVRAARLNLSTGKLHVQWRDNDVAPSVVLSRVRSLGYEAQPYDAPEALDAGEREGRDLLHALAVAGFGAVFVVGLTDAVWYGGADMSVRLRDIFFWLAGAVSIPLTLYASVPFFRSAWKSLSHRQTNMDVPISLAIILSLALSVYVTATHGESTYFDAAIMLAFLLLIGRYLDFRLRDRARSAAKHLLALQSALARRLKSDGAVETVAAVDLQPGDQVLLASGERAPVDGVILSNNTDVDVSLVTGESAPVAMERGATLHAGSIIIGAPVTMAATARVENSLVADLARLLETGQQRRSLYVRVADRAAKAYVPFVIGLSLIVFGGWMIAGVSLDLAITNAITVLIITCPCALGLAVPAVQIVATGRLFERGIFVKSGDALERLAEIDTAVFDKTGTLTFGTPQLANAREISSDALASAAMLARASNHPLAKALAAAAGDGPVGVDVREVAGAGLEAEVGGMRQRLGNAIWCGTNSIAHSSELWFRNAEQAPVRFCFHDEVRPETTELVAQLKQRGITILMLTGDRAAVASQLAAKTGIEHWKAEVDPKAKAAILESLRAEGRKVLMVGDGINDAGALALAYVSIAPGTAADVSQRAADMILRGNSLSPIIEAVDVAQKARRLVNQNFGLAVLYNIVAIPMAAFGIATPLIAAACMAGSSLVVTVNALRLARPFA